MGPKFLDGDVYSVPQLSLVRLGIIYQRNHFQHHHSLPGRNIWGLVLGRRLEQRSGRLQRIIDWGMACDIHGRGIKQRRCGWIYAQHRSGCFGGHVVGHEWEERAYALCSLVSMID
jgi:hypothetical protein